MGNSEFKPDQNEVNEDISEEQAEKIGEGAIDTAEKVAEDEPKNAEAAIANAGPDVEPMPVVGEPSPKPLEFKDLPEFGTPESKPLEFKDLPEFGTPESDDAKGETINNGIEFSEEVRGEICEEIIGLFDGEKISADAKEQEKDTFIQTYAQEIHNRASELVDVFEDGLKRDGEIERGALYLEKADKHLVAVLEAFHIVKLYYEEDPTISPKEAARFREAATMEDYSGIRKNAGAEGLALVVARSKFRDDALDGIASGLEVLADNLEGALSSYYDSAHEERRSEEGEGMSADESLARMRAVVSKIGGTNPEEQ